MSPILYILFFLGSAAVAGFVYFLPLWQYSNGAGPYTMAIAIASMMFLFMSRVKLNEQGHVVFLGFPINIVCGPGTYWMPNALPFLQSIAIPLGFGIEHERVSSFGEVGGNPNITHNHDVRLNSYRVTHETNSLFALNADRLLGLLGAFLFSFHDREGRFKYYKLGGILYAVAWVLAFANHAGNYASAAVTTAGQVVEQGATSLGLLPQQPALDRFGRIVQLNVGTSPKIPEEAAFVAQPSETFADFDGREYLFYTKPAVGQLSRIVVKGSPCSMVPRGERIFYWTKVPPTHASNMDDRVMYLRKKYGFALGTWFEDFLLEPSSSTWIELRNHWVDVESGNHPILVQAMKGGGLPKDGGGGLVCF